MRNVSKLLLLILSFLGVLFSVCVFLLYYPIEPAAGLLNQSVFSVPYVDYIMVFYSLITGICFFALLLYAAVVPSRSKFLRLQRSKGTIQISRKTIESAARYSFAELKEVVGAHIRVKLHRNPDKIKIYVTVTFNDTKEIAVLTETIQNNIESALQTSLGIPIRNIAVRVVEYSPNTGTTKDSVDSQRVV